MTPATTRDREDPAGSRYLGGILVAPNASTESRDVLVHIVTGRTRWNLVRAWCAVAMRRAADSRIVVEATVRGATIETEPMQYVSVDGEIAARTPIRISVAREALNVMVPASFDDQD